MSEIFGIGIMGGGSGPAYAAISVMYPAGATCTCALGSKTFTAPDTSGQALFIVPYAGEWVVAISQSGQETKSQTVNVTESKAYIINISFGLIIFADGNINSSVVGDAQSKAWMLNSYFSSSETRAPQFDITSDLLRIWMPTSSAYKTGAIIFSNDIDLSDYNSVNLTLDQPLSGGDRFQAFMCVGKRTGTYAQQNAWAIIGDGQTSATLDISEVQETEAVYIAVRTNNGVETEKMLVERMWLE